MRPVLGIVSIGQTPRPDLIRVFGAAAPHAEVRVAGALDGITEAELAAIVAPGDYPLLVRLASGASAEVPMARLVPRVEEAARALAAQGAAAVVIACAGGFPDVPCPVPVILPGRIVPAVAGALCRTGRVGIVTPNRAQIPFADRKWRSDGFSPTVTWASPTDERDMMRAAEDLLDPAIELIVLDCMGHDDGCRAAMANRTGRPVLAAQSLVAHVAATLI